MRCPDIKRPPANGTISCNDTYMVYSKCSYGCDSLFGMVDTRFMYTECIEDPVGGINGYWNSSAVPVCLREWIEPYCCCWQPTTSGHFQFVSKTFDSWHARRLRKSFCFINFFFKFPTPS